MLTLNLMKRNLLMNSQLSDGKTSPLLIWMQIVNLIFYDHPSCVTEEAFKV